MCTHRHKHVRTHKWALLYRLIISVEMWHSQTYRQKYPVTDYHRGMQQAETLLVPEHGELPVDITRLFTVISYNYPHCNTRAKVRETREGWSDPQRAMEMKLKGRGVTGEDGRKIHA